MSLMQRQTCYYVHTTINGLKTIKKFRNYPFRQKLLVGYGIIGLFALLIALFGFIGLQISQQEQKNLIVITDARNTAHALDVKVLDFIITLQYYADTEEPGLLDKLKEQREDARLLREELRSITTQPETIQLLDKYDAAFPARVAAADKLIAALQSDESSEIIQQLKTERRILDVQSRDYVQQIILTESNAVTTEQARISSMLRDINIRIILFVIVTVFLIVIFIVLITRSVTRPLRELSTMAMLVASGSFNARNHIDTQDEIGTLAKTFNDMAQQIEELDKAKDEFIGVASHQLRTPATAVKNFIGLLKEGYAGDLTKEQKEYVDFAYKSNEDQLMVIDDLLRVARAESGRMELEKKSLNVSELVDHLVKQQYTDLTERQQSIEVECADKELSIFADEDYMKMAVGNIIGNASKYTPEKGKIKISVRGNKKSVIIEISDNGVGIPEEDIGKLFNKFTRIQNKLSAKVGGTGIGLYLSKKIIVLHGGTISVQSKSGEGTTFIIEIPKVNGE